MGILDRISVMRRNELNHAQALESLPVLLDHGIRDVIFRVEESLGIGSSENREAVFTTDNFCAERVERFFTQVSGSVDRAFNRHGFFASSVSSPVQAAVGIPLETLRFASGLAAGIVDTSMEATEAAMQGRLLSAAGRVGRMFVVGAVGAVAHFMALQPAAMAFVYGKITGEETRDVTPFLVSQSATHAAFSQASAGLAVMGAVRGVRGINRAGLSAVDHLGSAVTLLGEKISSFVLGDERPMVTPDGQMVFMSAQDGAAGSGRSSSPSSPRFSVRPESYATLADGLMRELSLTSDGLFKLVGELKDLEMAESVSDTAETGRVSRQVMSNVSEVAQRVFARLKETHGERLSTVINNLYNRVVLGQE